MSPREAFENVVLPGLGLLPAAMISREATVLLLATGFQESDFRFRRQQPRGPARGFFQFEPGSRLFGGGVWGVYTHKASRYWLYDVCQQRSIPFDAKRIYNELEFDDALATAVARLLYFTDPRKLPPVGDQLGAYDYYMRNWRPGKKRPQDWPGSYALAMEAQL